MTFVFIGLVLLVCLISFIAAASSNKESNNFAPSFISIGIFTLAAAFSIYLDNITNNILVLQANGNTAASVQALKEDAVKNGVATFKATPEGKVVFEWVNTNPTEKPLTNPK